MKEQKEISKFEQWKNAIKNTPPERLLRINMQGYILQSIGLIVVCIMILLIKDSWWWLIFAFIFGLFNNYSGFVSNYQQYNQIIEYKKLANIKEEDKSPHRNKAKLIKKRLGKKVGWITAFSSAVISYLIVPKNWKWYFKSPAILFILCISYYLIYFKFFYWVAKIVENDTEEIK